MQSPMICTLPLNTHDLPVSVFSTPMLENLQKVFCFLSPGQHPTNEPKT